MAIDSWDLLDCGSTISSMEVVDDHSPILRRSRRKLID